ncbi:hypothetical protein UCREL1_11221 [Eutypa lata UCREL1]|uniref:Uncharacterized protein n=1 Tax=Eutypa lata (strain UCR-EL1) TaxID=1287681 RepID=M7SCD7_EUTLA|nr:hypothetical protein UCREL1_11221 [Eutypa lata UCREL1]
MIMLQAPIFFRHHALSGLQQLVIAVFGMNQSQGLAHKKDRENLMQLTERAPICKIAMVLYGYKAKRYAKIEIRCSYLNPLSNQNP